MKGTVWLMVVLATSAPSTFSTKTPPFPEVALFPIVDELDAHLMIAGRELARTADEDAVVGLLRIFVSPNGLAIENNQPPAVRSVLLV